MSSAVNIPWATQPATFSLESDTTSASTEWQAVAAAPTTVNGKFQVTLPINQTECHFRLRGL